MKNKATEVREALGLTQREAGELFAGQSGQNASDTWGRWERTGKWPKPADVLLDVIIVLKIADDLRTPGAGGALKIVLDMLSLKIT